MRLLLDTHTLYWSADDPSKLSAAAMTAIQEPANDRLLSAATIWELAIKFGQGKIGLSLPFRQWMERAVLDVKLDEWNKITPGRPVHAWQRRPTGTLRT